MDVTLTLLGTGTSHGVPFITCECAVCTSDDPRNQRFRCSALLQYGGRNVLVDTATEFRLQAIRARMTRLDAILFTHSHADHVGGLDDVRVFSELQGQPIPCYGSPQTLEDIRRRFDYIFAETSWVGTRPRLELHPIDGPLPSVRPGYPAGARVPRPSARPRLPLRLRGLRDRLQPHPPRIDGVAAGPGRAGAGCPRRRPHPTHFSLDQALAVVDELRARP